MNLTAKQQVILNNELAKFYDDSRFEKKHVSTVAEYLSNIFMCKLYFVSSSNFVTAIASENWNLALRYASLDNRKAMYIYYEFMQNFDFITTQKLIENCHKETV